MSPFEKYGNNKAPQKQKIPYMVDGVPQLDNIILPSDDTIQGIKDEINAFFDRLAFPNVRDDNPDWTQRMKDFVSGWCEIEEDSEYYPDFPRKVQIIRDFLKAGGSFVSKKRENGEVEFILVRNGVVHNTQELVFGYDELERIILGEWFAIDCLPEELEYQKNQRGNKGFFSLSDDPEIRKSQEQAIWGNLMQDPNAVGPRFRDRFNIE